MITQKTTDELEKMLFSIQSESTLQAFSEELSRSEKDFLFRISSVKNSGKGNLTRQIMGAFPDSAQLWLSDLKWYKNPGP